MKEIISLEFAMTVARLGSWAFQVFSAFLKFLNLAVILLALSKDEASRSNHPCCITDIN